jgi:hypothetical protein
MKFNLGPHTIQVIYDDNTGFTSRLSGLCEWDKNVIRLDGTLEGTIHDHVLWHEITHMILHVMGKEKLMFDEEFVNTFSGLLTQAINSMEESWEGDDEEDPMLF